MYLHQVVKVMARKCGGERICLIIGCADRKIEGIDWEGSTGPEGQDASDGAGPSVGME